MSCAKDERSTSTHRNGGPPFRTVLPQRRFGFGVKSLVRTAKKRRSCRPGRPVATPIMLPSHAPALKQFWLSTRELSTLHTELEYYLRSRNLNEARSHKHIGRRCRPW